MRLFLLLALLGCDPHDGDDDDTGDTQVDPLDPDVAPVTEGDWARPDARTTWNWQLQGTLNTGYPSEIYDVDLFDTSAATIAALQADDKLVFCYLSAGSLEDWRDDADAFPAAAVGDTLSGFPDERWLDVRHPAVHAAMLDRLDLAVTKGCDGVEPDNVDGYQADTGFPITALEQLAYNRFLYNAAHSRDLSVAMKNDLDQVEDLVAYADVAVNEQCHEYGECALLQPFLDAGKPVLNAEYLADYAADPAAFCREALVAGTRSLILSPDLDDSVRVSCDEDFPSDTGLSDVVTYTTYYGRDADRIAELASLDLAIVQPLLTADQRAALQARAKLAVYLSIGEIGLSNTYIVGGEEVLGQVVYDAHPEWFLGQNPFFDSWFADANQVGWQDFVLDQADQLLAQGYDGLFMDTVDTVDVYPATIPGMVTLIERLRAAHPTAVLVQNRGMNVIPQSGPSVDALMFEVFSTRYDFDAEAYTETDTTAPGYPEIVDKAVDYRLSGGVVLAQDFAEPTDTELICYARDRALMHLFVPAYADKFFQDGLYDYPSECPWPEEPVLGVAFDPQVAHVPLGRSVSVDVLLDRFDEDTTLSLGTPPAGVTADLDDASVTTASPGVISLSATAAPGTYVLPVQASGGGQARTFDLRVVVHDETVWVTNAGLSDVVAFDEPADAVDPVFPDRRTGGVVSQPYAIAVDAAGDQWVVENVGDPAATQPAGRVLRYAPFDLAAPDLVIDGGLNYPTGVAVDSGGTVWVANSALDWTGTPRGTPNVATVTPPATTAVEAFQYAHASFGYPRSLAVYDGDVWVTTTYGLVLGFSLPASNPATPFAVLSGLATGDQDDLFDTVTGLVFDAQGDLWLSASLAGSAQVVEVPAGSWATNGTTTSVPAVGESALLTDGLYGPWGLAFDSAGDLWVVNSTDAADTADSAGSLVRFDTLSTGASPAQVIPLESRFTLGIAIARP